MSMQTETKRRMPIKVNPYEHQKRAFDFIMQVFGLEGGDAHVSAKAGKGVSLLAEM